MNETKPLGGPEQTDMTPARESLSRLGDAIGGLEVIFEGLSDRLNWVRIQRPTSPETSVPDQDGGSELCMHIYAQRDRIAQLCRAMTELMEDLDV